MREAATLAERVAATDANVLVTGESGSGKDAMAAFITDSVATPRPAAAISRRRVRAWVVTAVVMAADVALLFSWHRSRVKSSSKRPHPQRWRHHARPQA